MSACQDLQHCVAVTGDGVNDSPAIKKADIGIAMGKVGTEVAKDAADIILLDDDFSNIIQGIRLGRAIFDTLKKITAYALCSNVGEFVPYLIYFILQFPLALTTLQIILISAGTDILPSVAYAYEVPEGNIMKKQPRNMATEHLCSVKLFCYSYLFNGLFLFWGPFVTFLVVLSDFGFKPWNLYYFVGKIGTPHEANDVINGYDLLGNGNSNYFILNNLDLLGIYQAERENYLGSYRRVINYVQDELMDNRLFFADTKKDYWNFCGHDSIGLHGNSYCYNVEATKYATGAYFMSLVIGQIFNSQLYRTLQLSITEHNFKNNYLNMAYLFELALAIFLCYCPGINEGFNTRPLRIEHWVPCMLVFINLVLFDEFRKWIVRVVKNPDKTKGFFNFYFNI